MNTLRDAPYNAAQPRPRFFADAMLGRLAKWLRLLGYDVAYEKKIGDRDLIERALAEGRVILTRDSHFKRRRLDERIEMVLLENDRLSDQLRRVVREFRLPTDRHRLTRCVECNLPVAGIPRESAAGRVPVYVFQNQERFSECPGCNRIYWAGTHMERIDSLIQQMLDPPGDTSHG